MEAEHLRARVARAEALAHEPRPKPARGAELRDLFEEVVVRVEEEGEARGELVDLQARVDRGLDVGDGVGEREGDLLHGGRARLADVVAADMEIVFQFGTSSAQKAKMSVTSRSEGAGG